MYMLGEEVGTMMYKNVYSDAQFMHGMPGCLVRYQCCPMLGEKHTLDLYQEVDECASIWSEDIPAHGNG